MSVVIADKPAPGLLRLLINRPAKRNAIDFDVREQLTHALFEARADTSVRAVVLGGVDGVFSAGGDLDSMEGLDETGARERMQHIHRLCRALAHLPVPVVSAVEGFCAGAAVGMALLGDAIVVGKSTKIIFPFMKLGLVPDWGTMLTLPRRVGVANARRLMTEGKITMGGEAKHLGLADVYVDDFVMTAAVAHATFLTSLPQDTFARFKSRLNFPSNGLDEELAREEGDQAALLLGPEFTEGFAATREKRAPDFLFIDRNSEGEEQ